MAGLVGMGTTAFHKQINDNSFLWHVRAGDAQIESGSVLTVDPFTFTALGRPWRTQSWLADLLYSWLDQRIGLYQVPWIVLGCWLVFTGGILAIIRTSTRSTFHTALVAVMTATVTVGFFNPRPAVFSFGLFCLLILADQRPRLRWTVPLIMWLWVSIHGSFFIGALYLILKVAQRRDPTRLPAIVAAGVTSLSSAHGAAVVMILLGFARGGQALDLIQEWAVPDFLSLPFLSVPIAILVMLAAGMKGILKPVDLWVITPFVLLAFDANRTVPAAWLALLPFFTASLASLVPRYGAARLPRFVPVLAGAFLLAGLIGTAGKPEFDLERFPVEASRHLSGTRLFASDGAAGYLVYSQWPDRLIYVDDRAELLYEEIPEMVRLRGADPSWRESFRERQFDEALVSRHDPIGPVLVADGWDLQFEDEHWLVLVAPA